MAEFLPELRTRRVKWFAETDLSVADDPELLGLMRESGCAEVLIGFESPVEDGLDDLELRRNWKRRQFPRYLSAIARIQSQGIRVNACFVVGLDGHSPGIFDAVFEFVEEAAAVRRADHLSDSISEHAAIPPAQAAGPADA